MRKSPSYYDIHIKSNARGPVLLSNQKRHGGEMGYS